jgi:diguanylate cyclase (GGDEF)-like protein
MTLLDDRPSTMSIESAPPGGEIVAVAHAATDRADRDPTIGELVIVARTADGGHRAVSGGHVGPLRAAVSVAVAAGNDRMWRDVTGTETVECAVRSMPEIVRTAAEASDVLTAHVGCIDDGTVAAVAVWFERAGNSSTSSDRRTTMELLAGAAERHRSFFAARAAEEARRAPAAGPDDTAGRRFDPDDPSIDRVTGLAIAADFEAALEEYDHDEATLLVVDLDGFAAVAAEYGDRVADGVLREIADRLVAACRREDLIARLGPDTFAVLLADATRSVGLHVAKRLLDTIAEPLAIAGGPESVTATVALAHQFGLVDMDELRESAEDAVASGKRAGAGRLVIAS